MGQRRAGDVADLLAAVGVNVVQTIVLADDGGGQRTVDHLGQRVVGVVGITAVDAIGQPFLFQSATGVVARHGL